jgi:hypothetical protein
VGAVEIVPIFTGVFAGVEPDLTPFINRTVIATFEDSTIKGRLAEVGSEYIGIQVATSVISLPLNRGWAFAEERKLRTFADAFADAPIGTAWDHPDMFGVKIIKVSEGAYYSNSHGTIRVKLPEDWGKLPETNYKVHFTPEA